MLSKTDFERRNWRLGSGLSLLLGVAALAGCNDHSMAPLMSVSETTGSIPAKKQSRRNERKAQSRSTALKAAFKPNGEYFRTASEIRAEPSARCRRVLAQAGITSTSLRSPSLSAKVSDEADFDVGMSYDILDLKRANLTEELAFARCERQEIAAKLIQLTTTSTQSLSRSGYLARANVLRSKRKKLLRINGEISRALREGFITIGGATVLRQYIEQVRAREAQSRGEAGRRQAVEIFQDTDFRALDRRLMRIERTVHDIEARRRTVDALKVQASANYGTDIGNSFGAGNRGNDLSATLEVSVRLGALYGRRFELEEISREAGQSLHNEIGSGVLWRSTIIRDSISTVLVSLRKQRADVVRAMTQAQRNARIATDEQFAEDLVGARLRAEVDLVSLSAELAALDATIRDTRSVVAKLNFKK
ncbi:hypothetical protein ACFQ14_07475 [Pseudahrensia aquimaris]|uniref:Outer membrane efflux protein n=1 Tax=Pseudahrensia aquimaris TaxID=744461 RepID=A0ABW3FHE7_9HYPH